MSVLRIFVKRGAIWRFHRLSQDASALPITVEWDRRREDRRESTAAVPHDQRKEERRGSAPMTWDVAQFVVVDDAQPTRNPH